MDDENENAADTINYDASNALLREQIEKEIISCQQQRLTNALIQQKQLFNETKQVRQMNNLKRVQERDQGKNSIESTKQMKENTSHPLKTPIKKQFHPLWTFSTPSSSGQKEQIENKLFHSNERLWTNEGFSSEKQDQINHLPSLQTIIQEFLRFRSDYRATRLINYEKFEQLESYRRLLREGMLPCPSNEQSYYQNNHWQSSVEDKINNKENTWLQPHKQNNQVDKHQNQSWQYYPQQLGSLQCMESLSDSPADVIISKSSFSKLSRYKLFLSHFFEDTQLMRQLLSYIHSTLENIETSLLETQNRIKTSYLQLQETFFSDHSKRDYLERLQKQLDLLESHERSTDNSTTQYQSYRFNAIIQQQYQQNHQRNKDLNDNHSHTTSHHHLFQKQDCLEPYFNNSPSLEQDISYIKSSHPSSCQISLKKQQKLMQQTLNNQQQHQQQQFIYTQFNSPECPSSNKGSFSVQKSAEFKTTPIRKKPAVGSFIRLAASENGTTDFYNLYGGSCKSSPFVSDFK